MIKRISFVDLLGVIEEEFGEKLREVDLLVPKVLQRFYPLLNTLGLDTRKDLYIQACKHRRWNGDIVVNYTVTGFERNDDEWLNSGMGSLSARIERNNDPYLKAELYQLSKEGIGESGWNEMVVKSKPNKTDNTDITSTNEEEDYEQTAALLEKLKKAQRDILGYAD